jgi:hypothetical protein
MLIMELLVLGIGFIKNIMNLLLDVLDSLNKFGFSINLGLSMGGLFLVQLQWVELRQWGQWLEPQAHLKRVVANRVVEVSVVAMLNIRKDFIPCAWMFGIYILGIWTIILLTTSICPSVYGWKVSIWSAWCPSSTIGWTKKCSGTYCINLR